MNVLDHEPPKAAAHSATREVDWQDFREHLATADKDGNRRWLYPKKPAGRWYRRRTCLSWLLIGVMFTGPFVRIGGNPLLMMNIMARKFSILGRIFWPEDSIIFAVAMLTNFAFRMLRSVDFRAMTIGMEGDLGGEVVTSVSFGGISQGKGAERNLVTRQLANLPIRFDINVRSQFRHLMSTLGSLYDPSLLPDPRSLGLVDIHGRPLHHHGAPESAGAMPAPLPPALAGQAIQPQASGTMP